MANAALIATGVVRLTRKNLTVPFLIDAEGVKMMKQELGPQAFFEEYAGRLTSLRGNGHLVFANMLMSPKTTAVPVELVCTGEGATITVEHFAKFNEFPNAHFSDLKVVFTQDAQSVLRLVESALTMTLMESTLQLRGKLNRKGFFFDLASVPQTVALEHIGTASLSKVDVAANTERWADLALMYNFSEITEDTVFDNAPAAPRLDLKLSNTTKVAGGGLRLSKTSEAVSVPLFQRVATAMHESKAFTIELWLKPTISGRNKAGTILSMGNPDGRPVENYLDVKQDNAGNVIIDGTYTTTVGGFEGPLLVPKNLHHLVLTHDSSGTEQIYLNGELQATRSVNSEVQPAVPPLLLTLGNAAKRSNPWAGEFFGVAIYSRALSADELSHIAQPFIGIEGMFTIANAPAPFDGMLPATFELLGHKSLVAVDIDDQEFVIRPELVITDVHLQWRGFGNKRWQLLGEAQASFWGSKVPMTVGLSGGNSARPGTVNTNPRLELVQKDSPVTITLDQLGTLEFTGITLKVARRGQPKWELSSTSDQEFVILPAIRFRAFDLFADMLLEAPQLGLTDEHLVLNGRWLDEAISLHASRATQDLRMLASAAFGMVFDLVIPTILDPQTGEVLNDGARLDQQVLDVNLDLELSQNGLLTNVNSNFNWVDQEGVAQETIVPPFTLFTPPPNKNAILGHINDNVQANINELFSETGKQAVEYYLDVGTDQPVVYLSSDTSEPEVMETITPLILSASDDIGGADSIFWLSQTADSSKLTINVKDKPIIEIDEAYDAFIRDLASRSVSAAAIQLIQRRIAERLPLTYDRLLTYYYGWNKEAGYIDLRSGMRLRIDFQNYQFVQASDQSAERGFTGSGSTYVELVTYTQKFADQATYEQFLGFDPFLSQLDVNVPIDIAADGAGGLYDLQKFENKKAVYRLFLPLNPSPADLGPERITTIIGTDTVSEMIDVTEKFNPDANIPPETGISFFFRGKATITPEIQVFVRDQAIHVPIGTTLRQLIQRFDDMPQGGIGAQDLSAYLNMGRPLRLVHEGIDSTPAYRFINIKDAGAVNQMDALDLPLVKGDRFYF